MKRARSRHGVFRTALVALVVAVAVPRLAAQDPDPVFTYSRLTSTFDGQLPIGQRFEIKGPVDGTMQGVRVESFGFSGQPPTALTDAGATAPEFCEALDAARSQAGRTVIHTAVSWERPNPTTTQFRVKHPRLYFGRNYVFVFAYYADVDSARLVSLLARELNAAFTGASDFASIMRSGISGAALRRRVDDVIATAPGISCDVFVEREGQRGSGFLTNVLSGGVQAMLDAMAREATRQMGGAQLRTARTAYDALTDPLAFPASATGDATFQTSLQELQRAISDENWDEASLKRDELVPRAGVLQTAGTLTGTDFATTTGKLSALRDPLSDLALASQRLLSIPRITPDSVARLIASGVSDAQLRPVLASTTVRPYFETMKEALPFVVSLDGGLVYAFEFEAVIPTVAVNIKLNRVDFDDPISRKPEFSILVGVGLNGPDDLDPDYRGIFSTTGNDALLVSLGARFPALSRLIRLHVGVLIYRQEEFNPLVDDLVTKASVVVGASLNWDVLDFAAKLLTGRPSLNLGGG